MRRIVSLIALISLSGCASFTPQLGFKEVNDGFSTHTGNYLYWNTGTPEDEKVTQEISKLLSSELTADTATQIALLNNKGLQAVYQQLGIAQADLVDAGLFPNPIFNGEIRFPSGGPNLELSVVQSFVKIFEIPLRKKIAQSEFEEAKIDVIERALLLAYQTRKAFYEYQASEQLLEMANTALVALEASNDLATRLHRAGNITDLDLAQEQSNYESLKIEVIARQEELISAREELNSLMGLEINQTSWKSAQRLPENSALPLEDVNKSAISNNLALAKSRQQLVTLAASLDVAETFRVFDETELGVSGAKEPGSKWGSGPAFSFPIPFFNQGSTQIFRVNAQLNQQHNRGMALQTKIEAHIRSLLSRLKLVEARLLRYKKVLLPLQTKLVSETQKQYNAMLIGAFQLLEVKHRQIETGKDYILALKSYWQLRTELESVLNGIVPSMAEGGRGES
jgi:outer membrane protein, heavy metal efflux system